jgi:Icc protein
MGNHDSLNIKQILCDNIAMPEYLDIDNHRFIFVSSYKGNNYDDGYVSQESFKLISELINPNLDNYILVHHHFIYANGIIDNWIMENNIEFSNYIKSHPIKAVFHGHVHNSYIKILDDKEIYAAPSTCIQFSLKPQLELEPIVGFQVLNLLETSYEYKVISQKL